jgi:hypothetical protein
MLLTAVVTQAFAQNKVKCIPDWKNEKMKNDRPVELDWDTFETQGTLKFLNQSKKVLRSFSVFVWHSDDGYSYFKVPAGKHEGSYVYNNDHPLKDGRLNLEKLGFWNCYKQ